jgi:hypothetical protein
MQRLLEVYSQESGTLAFFLGGVDSSAARPGRAALERRGTSRFLGEVLPQQEIRVLVRPRLPGTLAASGPTPGCIISLNATLPGGIFNIYVISSAGGTTEHLLPSDEGQLDVDWSPDGNHLPSARLWIPSARFT